MHQALRSLAVLPDDEQAYSLHHKAEAEKRLMTRRDKDKEDTQVEVTKIKPVPFSTGSIGSKKVIPARANGPQGQGLGLGQGQGQGQGQDRNALSATTAYFSSALPSNDLRHEANIDADTDPDTDARVEAGVEGSWDVQCGSIDVLDHFKTDAVAASSGKNIPTEECSSQRVAEIRRTLLGIYADYSPEKVPKIDRLLGKYAGREEEFLHFVHEKYNIDASGAHALPSVVSVSVSESRVATADSAYNRSSENSSSSGKEVVAMMRRKQSVTSADVSTCSSAQSTSRSRSTCRSRSESRSRSSSGSPSSSPRGRHDRCESHRDAGEDGSHGTGKEGKSIDAEAYQGSRSDSLRGAISTASRCVEPLPPFPSSSASSSASSSSSFPSLAASCTCEPPSIPHSKSEDSRSKRGETYTSLGCVYSSHLLPYPFNRVFSFDTISSLIPDAFCESLLVYFFLFSFLSSFLSLFLFLFLFLHTVESNCRCPAQRLAQRHISLVRTYVPRMQAAYLHHTLRKQTRRLGKQTCLILFLCAVHA